MFSENVIIFASDKGLKVAGVGQGREYINRQKVGSIDLWHLPPSVGLLSVITLW
jgi:hypothetical protein